MVIVIMLASHDTCSGSCAAKPTFPMLVYCEIFYMDYCFMYTNNKVLWNIMTYDPGARMSVS